MMSGMGAFELELGIGRRRPAEELFIKLKERLFVRIKANTYFEIWTHTKIRYVFDGNGVGKLGWIRKFLLISSENFSHEICIL